MCVRKEINKKMYLKSVDKNEVPKVKILKTLTSVSQM